MGGARRALEQQAQKARALAALAELPFRPSPWLVGANRQTLFAPAVCRREAPAPSRLERWVTPDEDFLRLHFFEGAPGGPVALLLHGLEGSARSIYLVRLTRLLVVRGYTVVVLEQRSCGGELNRAPRLYHLGETGDLDFVVQGLLARFPGRALCAAGYSGGGNQLAKWLGERGDAAPAELCVAAVISAPFDLQKTGPHLDEALYGLYTRVFLRSLIPKALAKARQHPGCLDVEQVRRARTFWAFDDCATAPLHGFQDAWHYWGEASSSPLLEEIRRPTLLLSARDDPFFPPETLPEPQAARSAWLHGVFPETGGHVGFIGGAPWRPHYWGERQVTRFFEHYTGW